MILSIRIAVIYGFRKGVTDRRTDLEMRCRFGMSRDVTAKATRTIKLKTTHEMSEFSERTRFTVVTRRMGSDSINLQIKTILKNMARIDGTTDCHTLLIEMLID